MLANSRSTSHSAWADDWEVGLRVWVERQGKSVLGDGPADLLSAIERTQSITAAAHVLGMSYRHAWKLVQAANEAAGEPLVEAAVGGKKGGGARLTPRGKRSLAIFQQMSRQLRQSAGSILQRAVTAPTDPDTAIHLAAAISLQEVVGQLLTEYSLRKPLVRVRAVYGASNELAEHVLAGAPCDLFLSADRSHLDQLSASKLILANSRTILAQNSLLVIGCESGPERLATPQQLLDPRVKRIALADPASPLGKVSKAYLDRLDLYDALRPKVVAVDNSRAVLAAIRSGVADAALAFSSDALHAEGCRILLTVDGKSASLSYVAAICRGPRSKETQTLLDFFRSDAAKKCFRRCGLKWPTARRTGKL